MVLSINSPSYFSTEYGIDDEVYWMCRSLSRFVEEKNYSNLIHTIGIVPLIAPKEMIDCGKWREYIDGMPKYGVVTVSVQTDFYEYLHAGIRQRKWMIIDNILRSVKKIAKRYKIDYLTFEADVKKFCIENSITCEKDTLSSDS